MNFIKLPHKKTLTLLRKAVALSTAFLFLFNISSEAFVNIKQFIPQEVVKEIRTILSEAAAPEQTPKEYLKEILENIEKTISESDNPKDDSKKQPKDKEENKIPEKLDLKTYEAKYKKSLAIQYEDYNKEIESQAKAALEEFDKTAAEEIENQEKLLTTSSEDAKPKYDLFASNDFENSFNPTFSYRAKLDNYINKQKNETKQTTNSNSLKIKPKDTTPQNPLSKNLTEKIRAGLKTNNAVSGITGQEYLFNKQVEEMETNKRRAKLDQINQKMEELKEAIKEQRGLYENEIATWKANAFKKLEEEKAQMIKNIPDSYKEYAALYDREFAQLQKEEIA